MIGQIVNYPDGTDEILRTLDVFKTLKKRQLKILMMQRDRRFNSDRAESLIEELIDRNIVFETAGNNISISKNAEKNNAVIAAFWVFLQFVDESTEFDVARYPSEIVFKSDDDVVSEIIVCEDDFLEKLDYLSKRKKRKNLCQYYILLLSNTIEEIDDTLFPDVPFTVITISTATGDVPKLMYHEIYTGDMSTQTSPQTAQNDLSYKDYGADYDDEEEEYEEGYERGH